MINSDFAVIVPAFNEAPVIPELIRELREAFRRHNLEGEVVLIDDGSEDDTGEVAEQVADGWRALRIVRHKSNLGKTEAMITGANSTSKNYLVLFDADLQHSPDEIPRFLEKLAEGWDIVTGRKVGAYSKRTVSSIYNRLSRKIFSVPVSDLNSMKAFRREILDPLTLRHDWHRFFVVLAHARGATVTEIDVDLYPRRAGISKYTSPFRILVGLLDLVSVGFLLMFSRKPLLLFGVAGLAFGSLGAMVAVATVYLRFLHPVLGFEAYIPPFGYRPLLYFVMLFETLGFLLVGFGLVSEQIAQLRDELDNLRKQ